VEKTPTELPCMDAPESTGSSQVRLQFALASDFSPTPACLYLLPAGHEWDSNPQSFVRVLLLEVYWTISYKTGTKSLNLVILETTL
jgi:hypothetical protein